MFHSVYRKDENYYQNVFLEKLIDKLFWRSITNFGFWDLEGPPDT